MFLRVFVFLNQYFIFTSFAVLRVAADLAVLLSSPGWASSGSKASCRIPLERDAKSKVSPLPRLRFTESDRLYLRCEAQIAPAPTPAPTSAPAPAPEGGASKKKSNTRYVRRWSVFGRAGQNY